MDSADARADLRRRLYEAVAMYACCPPEDLTPETLVFRDLTLYGGDFDELLACLPETAVTDWTAFRYGDHLPQEGLYPLQLMARWLRRGPEWRDLTLGHLEEVLLRRRWFDPVSGDRATHE